MGTRSVSGCMSDMCAAVVHGPKQFRAIFAIILAALMVMLPIAASAQPGEAEVRVYLADGLTTAIVVGLVDHDDAALAELGASEFGATIFLDSFTLMTNSRPATFPGTAAADRGLIDIPGAYVIYEGTLDFIAGVAPGYLIVAQVDGQTNAFIVGYEPDLEMMIGFVEEIDLDGDFPSTPRGFMEIES